MHTYTFIQELQDFGAKEQQLKRQQGTLSTKTAKAESQHKMQRDDTEETLRQLRQVRSFTINQV